MPAARLPRWANRHPPRGFAPRSAGRYTKPRGSPLLTTGTTSAVPLRGVNFGVCRGLDAVSGLWTPDAGERRPDRQFGGLPAPGFCDVPIWMCSEPASSLLSEAPSSRLSQTQYSTPINRILPVRHPCEHAHRGRPPNRGTRRDECLRPPRVMSPLRATASESYRRRYRAAFGPHAAGCRVKETTAGKPAAHGKPDTTVVAGRITCSPPIHIPTGITNMSLGKRAPSNTDPAGYDAVGRYNDRDTCQMDRLANRRSTKRRG